MRTFNLAQLAKMSGTPQSTLLHQGVRAWGFQPIQDAGIKGIEMLFSFKQAFVLIVGDQLRQHGVKADTIRTTIKFLLRTDFKARFDKGERYLVANRKQAFLACEDAVFTTDGPTALVVIDLARLMIRFTEAGLKLPRRNPAGSDVRRKTEISAT